MGSELRRYVEISLSEGMSRIPFGCSEEISDGAEIGNAIAYALDSTSNFYGGWTYEIVASCIIDLCQIGDAHYDPRHDTEAEAMILAASNYLARIRAERESKE